VQVQYDLTQAPGSEVPKTEASIGMVHDTAKFVSDAICSPVFVCLDF
jgi:hypothetical protein